MRRLLFVLAAAMVPAALVGTLLVGYDYYDRERTRLIRDSTGTARALLAAVEGELTGTRAALLALSTSPHLSSGNLAAFHVQALEALEDLPLQNLVLLDPQARQLVNTARPFGAPLPAQGTPSEMMRIFGTGEPVVSDLFVGPVLKRPAIAVGVAVRRGGVTRYSLNAGVSPERLTALLSGQKLPQGWIAAVFDTRGTVVARTHDAARWVGQKGAPELVRRMQQDSEDAFETHTVEGIPVLTVFTRSASSGWTVAIGIPQRELAANLFSSIARLFLVAFIVLLCALGLAVVLARRLLPPRS